MAKKPPLRKGSPNDFQTPPGALSPLLPYLKRYTRIWEPAAGKGNLVTALRGEGHIVIPTDILTGQDFRHTEPNERWEVIVTNPPYSIKNEFIARAYELGKPFAFLVPYSALETPTRQKLYKKHGVQCMFLDHRINFETPSGEGSGSWFPVMWLTWKLLPKSLMFQ